MKQTLITAGNFAGKDSKGNFSGYNPAGERIFINKKAMESLGWTKDSDVKYPFFAIVGEREFNTLDENGELTDKTFKRLQALSVYGTKEAMIQAYNAEASLEIEAKVALATTAKSSGLTEKAVEALLAAAV